MHKEISLPQQISGGLTAKTILTIRFKLIKIFHSQIKLVLPEGENNMLRLLIAAKCWSYLANQI